MINAHLLHQMYQAWQQGQEDYVRDWSYFVEAAAIWNNTTGDEIMRILQTTYWFKKPD